MFFFLRQGGGKRKGSIAVYLEPWHADIVAFLDLKKNHGNELERARDLFYAMWIPDLFMQVFIYLFSWNEMNACDCCLWSLSCTLLSNCLCIQEYRALSVVA